MLIILKAFLKSFGLFLSVKLKSKVSACKNYVTVITLTNFFVVVVTVAVVSVVVFSKNRKFFLRSEKSTEAYATRAISLQGSVFVILLNLPDIYSPNHAAFFPSFQPFPVACYPLRWNS